MQQRIPWVLHAASFCQALPLLAALRYRTRLPSPRPWIVVWCLTLLVVDGVQFWMGRMHLNNLWVSYIGGSVSNAIMLWTLSHWQPDSVSRLAFRFVIPLQLIAPLALIPALGPVGAVVHQRTWPFQGLVLLIGSLYTLVRCTSSETAMLTSRDWFWVTLGASLYYSIRVAQPTFVAVVLPKNPGLASVAYVVSAWIDILAFVLIARGMVCPLQTTRSGGSS